MGTSLPGQLREPELLSMLQYCLQKAPPTVQARTLGALQTLKSTDMIMKLARPCLTNPSPVVRLRAVEFFGMSKDPQREALMSLFAEKDPNEIVRAMAKALMPPPKDQPLR